MITAAKIVHFPVYAKFFVCFLAVVDDHGVARIGDVVAEQVDPCFADGNLPLVVQDVGPSAGNARRVSSFFQVEGAGDVVAGLAVGAGQVEADGGGHATAQFGDVGQSGYEAGNAHLQGRVAGDGGGIDGRRVSPFVGKEEAVAVVADGGEDAQAVHGCVEGRDGVHVLAHEIGRIVGISALHVVLASGKADQQGQQQKTPYSFHI